MKRRVALLTLLALGAAATQLGAQTARLPRIGYMLLGPRVEPPSRERQAFLDGLRELGYIPGKTVEIVYRSAESEVEFLDDMYQELLAQRVDVIVTSNTMSVLAAKKATQSVPIVMLGQGDPVAIGAVKSLARPGTNLTGVSFQASELAGKRVELLRECVPAVKRIAVLWDTRNRNSVIEAREADRAVRRVGASAELHGFESSRSLERELARLAERRPDALYVVFEGHLVASHAALIARFGLKHRLPIVSGWGRLAEAGFLLSYAPDIAHMFFRAASFVDRILRGARPEELPIEQPSRFELVANLKTARALGITIPRSVLVRADRLIQ